jgi:hypothetical protein
MQKPVLALILAWLAIVPAAADESSKCPAILPLKVMTTLPGYMNLNGTLLLNGESQCTVVNIDCKKESEVCAYSAVDVMDAGGKPVVTRILRTEYTIIKWAEGEIVASGEAGLCGWVEIYINLANKSATMNTRSTTARPGCDTLVKSELFKALVDNKTRVFTVDDDPYWKIIRKTDTEK